MERVGIRSRVLVDLEALGANWRALAGRAGDARCAGVVKADGYGLGAVPVTHALAAVGCRDFFVATSAEGLALRARFPDLRILVFDGPWPGEETLYRDARLTPVLNTREQVARWRVHGGGGPWWLHVDTGMSRLGVDPEEAAACSGPGLEGLLTHFACADEPASVHNDRQRETFEAVHAALRTAHPRLERSLANSAAVLLGTPYHGTLLRPGIGLYGSEPVPDRPAGLRCVARFQARVAQLRPVRRPLTVGYGATHVQQGGILATLAAGYADGYPRRLGNVASVAWEGRTLPLVGRVSMDTMVADASGVPGLAAGDWVDLMGGGVDIDALAARAGTIAYELLTGLGRRVPRIYLP